MVPMKGPGRCGTRRAGVALLGLLFLLASTAGCYRYVPADPDLLTRGDEVRAVISPRSVEVGEIAVRDVETVDGEFVTLDSDRIFLSALWLETRGGREFDGLGYTVDLERSALEQLLAKRMDVGRTLLLAGAISAGAIILQLVLNGGEGTTEGPPGSGGTPR